MALVAEVLAALIVGAGASIVGAVGSTLLSSRLRREESDTETFEVRSQSGKVVSRLELHRNPSPEETTAAIEQVHQDEKRLQHA